MSTRTFMLASAAAIAVAAFALMPTTASAFGRGNPTAAPARVVTSIPALSVRLRYGWGYGRGWCYWHPYVCYYR